LYRALGEMCCRWRVWDASCIARWAKCGELEGIIGGHMKPTSEHLKCVGYGSVAI
jgi:hypothetical protein